MANSKKCTLDRYLEKSSKYTKNKSPFKNYKLKQLSQLGEVSRTIVQKSKSYASRSRPMKSLYYRPKRRLRKFKKDEEQMICYMEQVNDCLILIMHQIQKDLSEYKSSIEKTFQTTLVKVKDQYKQRIAELEAKSKSKDEFIRVVQSKLVLANDQISDLRSQNALNLEKIQSYKEQVKNLKISLEKAETISNKELVQQQRIARSLQAQILELKGQNQKLIKQSEVYSVDYSAISRQDRSSFSMQISQLFLNSPHQILKFLQSIPGEACKDSKEEGDMTCMFVSKDGLSLDKFIRINRTFLKRTIKQHQKRFRFVLIHKPDKL